MEVNTYEYVLMWAEGCSTMPEGNPILSFDEVDFDKANSLAHKFKFLEKDGYILCTWAEDPPHRRQLTHCGITPKGIEYYEKLRSKKPFGIIRKNFNSLLYVTLAASCGALVTLWFKR